MITILLSLFGVFLVIIFGIFILAHSQLTGEVRFHHPNLVVLSRMFGIILILLSLAVIVMLFFVDEKLFQRNPEKVHHDAVFY